MRIKDISLWLYDFIHIRSLTHTYIYVHIYLYIHISKYIYIALRIYSSTFYRIMFLNLENSVLELKNVTT